MTNLLIMSLSAAEQGQTEQSSLLPKQLDAHKPLISRKKGALLLGIAAVVGLSTFFLSSGEYNSCKQPYF
jgi:hypothetical protein